VGQVGSNDKNRSSSRALNESGEPGDSRVKRVELMIPKRARVSQASSSLTSQAYEPPSSLIERVSTVTSELQ
jgi:hypothetical protein